MSLKANTTKKEKEVSEVLLAPRKTQVPTERSKVRVETLAEEIVKTGMRRATALRWAQEEFGVAYETAKQYYAAAMRYLRPDDPQKYREELINRNFAILEEMLESALRRNDLKNANSIIRTLNNMVGIGGNKVEIKDEGPSGTSKTVTISFA